ncbi:2-phosphosulfolactate phosphatase [Porphyromonas canoris]|uniref:2-phosphosulfolactate phosphatase n=1 Tax=Porphyromonas canoris TaxID=36875 RepID=UPI00068DFB98|nr:2-phosphosulfolactate phosphatase [Porphyromonas canoris]
MMRNKIKIDLCISPLLLPPYSEGVDRVVVVDVWRASSTIVTMLGNGAKAVYPLDSLEKAEAKAAMGEIVGAERDARRCSFARCGNSPCEYQPHLVAGRFIYFTTTNGTHALAEAMKIAKEEVLVGAFVNIEALARYLARHSGTVLILAAGWRDKMSLEDSLFAGALYSSLSRLTDLTPLSDSIRSMNTIWNDHNEELALYLSTTDHYARLEALGLEEDAAYCLKQSIWDVVPVCQNVKGETMIVDKQGR